MKQAKNQTVNYILCFREIVKRYTSLGTGRETLFISFKIMISFVLIAIIFLTLQFFGYTLAEYHSVIIVAVCLALGLAIPFAEDEAINAELNFFDDSIVLCRPKRFIYENIARHEIYEMNYTDIEECFIKHKLAGINFTWKTGKGLQCERIVYKVITKPHQ